MSYVRMHGDLVLPTIEELIGVDRSVATTPSVRSIPTAQSIVESSVRPRIERPRLVPPPFPRAVVRTVLTRRSARVRWPVFACGFVAGIFAGLALLTSPIAHRPAVARVVNAVTHR